MPFKNIKLQQITYLNCNKCCFLCVIIMTSFFAKSQKFAEKISELMLDGPSVCVNKNKKLIIL